MSDSFNHGYRDMQALIKVHTKHNPTKPMAVHFDEGEEVAVIHCDLPALQFLAENLPHADYATGQLFALMFHVQDLQDGNDKSDH